MAARISYGPTPHSPGGEIEHDEYQVVLIVPGAQQEIAGEFQQQCRFSPFLELRG